MLKWILEECLVFGDEKTEECHDAQRSSPCFLPLIFWPDTMTNWLGNLSFLLLLAAVPQQALAKACGSNGVHIYKDPSCSVSQRAADLLSRMSWEEKVKQLGGIRQVLGENMLFNETKFNVFNESQNGNIGT